MKRILFFLIIAVSITSCGGETEEQSPSVNPFYEFFYPYDSVSKVYVYRDVKNGLTEQFHRVYGITDSQGKHIVVEIYSEDGRILEALNYNVDSLNIHDHMVVDAKQTKNAGQLGDTQLMPLKKGDKGKFSSVFPATDSTLFLKDVSRKFETKEYIDVMGKRVEAARFNEETILTLMNPFSRVEGSQGFKSNAYYAKGYGLVEWHDTPSKQVHFKLEKIITQVEFRKLFDH